MITKLCFPINDFNNEDVGFRSNCLVSVSCIIFSLLEDIYSKGDIERLKEIMEETGGSALITTAKDAVKLYGIPDTGDILVQTMNLDVEGALPELMNDIQKSIDSHRKRNSKTGIL